MTSPTRRSTRLRQPSLPEASISSPCGADEVSPYPLKVRCKDSESIGGVPRALPMEGNDHATYEDASRTEVRWSLSGIESGRRALLRTQQPRASWGGSEEHCLRCPQTACGSRPAGARVAFFASATRKGRPPRSFGEGKTRRAHAISNVQELASREKAVGRFDK